MKQSEWKDRDIEDLVKKLPRIKDDRTPQSIYARMERQNKKRFFALNRLIPTVAALAAIFIMVMLAPTVLNQFNENSMGKSEMKSESSGRDITVKKAEESEGSSEMVQDSDKEQITTENENNQLSMAESEKSLKPLTEDRLSLYEEDLEGKDYYSYGLVSPEAVPVPVSVVDDPAEDEESWLARHEQLAGVLPEGSWGMEDFLPLKGKFTLEDRKVIFTLDADHSYSGSSSVEYAFYHSLLYSFQHQDLNEVVLQEQDGSVPQFSSTGEFSKVDLTEEVHTAYFLYSPNGRERFLVPDNINRGNVKESIQAMKRSDKNLFQSVIPKNINISVSDSDDYLTINFLNELDIETLDKDTALEMIEGLLLTSKSSGYERVLFENIKQESWNGFEFNEPIETPISPNKKSLEN
ncbi:MULTISPECIES: hypothetical protein [unclassified Rossellomorea]|uniref:hypothetical protein n=1 Tax=unclassified Rossellomorea TaxID=2837526 RepID=UPI0026079A74|nr:hypothetical protein [uncultured Rossellomorea sp.]